MAIFWSTTADPAPSIRFQGLPAAGQRDSLRSVRNAG
jgi:hypothetical protein